jgi:hypothetical protein
MATHPQSVRRLVGFQKYCRFVGRLVLPSLDPFWALLPIPEIAIHNIATIPFPTIGRDQSRDILYTNIYIRGTLVRDIFILFDVRELISWYANLKARSMGALGSSSTPHFNAEPK